MPMDWAAGNNFFVYSPVFFLCWLLLNEELDELVRKFEATLDIVAGFLECRSPNEYAAVPIELNKLSSHYHISTTISNTL